jgi:endonuclease/exonuclease/phosphatase (EEP) superfamily protein YafD
MPTGELLTGPVRTPAHQAGDIGVRGSTGNTGQPADRCPGDAGDVSTRASGGAVRRVFCLCLALAVLAGVVALVGPRVWSADPAGDSRAWALAGFAALLCEVFAFHGGLVLALIGGMSVLARERRLGAVILTLAGVHAGPGLLAMLTPPPAAAVPPGETLTVLSHNLLFSSASLDALGTIVDRERPDVILLQEVVTDRAGEVFDRFVGDYPHIVWPASHRWGSALLSRRPFVEAPDPVPGVEAWPIDQPVGVIDFDGLPVTVVGVHLPAPNSVDQLIAGPAMTADLAAWIDARADETMILAGDFNAPLWTSRMAALRQSGLARAHDAAGGGRGATWPARTPLRFAPGIRLDQVAFRGSLRCVESRVLEPTGSDHRPVLARFVRAESGPAR